METQELHRGRLIDHIQLVVRDLPAAQTFYTAVFKVLSIPMGGTGEGYFWADELSVSTADSKAAQGMLTGRHHLAFQTQGRAMVEAFYKTALAMAVRAMALPVSAHTIRATTLLSFWIPTVTTSKPYTTVKQSAVHPPYTSRSNQTVRPDPDGRRAFD